jgi:hypothetical protein
VHSSRANDAAGDTPRESARHHQPPKVTTVRQDLAIAPVRRAGDAAFTPPAQRSPIVTAIIERTA